MPSAIQIFCCYARKDQQFLKDFKNHLKPLERQGLINVWADIDISPGEEWEREIDNYINRAEIILLLVSPDFIASDYCYSTEMLRALEKHKSGDTCVIPIIIRPVYWQGTPLSKLQALPKDAVPVDSWSKKDEAFLSIIEDIHLTIKKLHQKRNRKNNVIRDQTQVVGTTIRSSKIILFRVLKIALYIFKVMLHFVGIILCEYGLITTLLFKNDLTSYNTVLIIGGLIILAAYTVVFFWKHYYLFCLNFSQYIQLIIGATFSGIVANFLSIAFISDKKGQLIVYSLSLLLYGVSLIVIASLKPSSSKRP